MAKNTKSQTVATEPKVKVQAPEFSLINDAQVPLQTEQVPLSRLISLDSTPIKNAKLAMRELNKQNLEHIMQAIDSDEQLPPMDVVNSTLGLIVIDGYHRWADYEQYLLDVLSDGGVHEVSPEILAKARTEFLVDVQRKPINSERELLQAAFSANLSHGLPATTKSRSRYALWLLDESEANGQPMSIRQAAKIAHVSHEAVVTMRKRIAAKNQEAKMLDMLVDDDGDIIADAEEQAAQAAEQKAVKETDKHLSNIAKAAKFIGQQTWTSTEVLYMVDAYIKDVNKDELDSLMDVIHLMRDRAKPAGEPVQHALPAAK